MLIGEVNDRVYGSGTGTTKQLAKEDAAKQAFYALGFNMLQDG
jgi:dsRNA-specific ribonuclease